MPGGRTLPPELRIADLGLRIGCGWHPEFEIRDPQSLARHIRA